MVFENEDVKKDVSNTNCANELAQSATLVTDAACATNNAEDINTYEKMPDLVLITGMSGAGRTEAIHVFEDMGYFCVDNLPALLIEELINLPALSQEKKSKIAVVCDARNQSYFQNLSCVLDKLKDEGVNYRVVFLDAADEKLIARYKSSRRRHPLCDDGKSISSGIARERMMLSSIKENASYVLDTTDLLPQQLRASLKSLFLQEDERKVLSVSVYSFGFKHAAPADADLVIDVRFLPNPYYDPQLKPLTGLDDAVRKFVLDCSETTLFEKRWFDLLDVVMPGYVSEGKQQLAIAIGCTGGQHRSVVLAEETGNYLKSQGYRVSIAHRDLGLANSNSGKSWN
jgi:RNase adapter protein RapZ